MNMIQNRLELWTELETEWEIWLVEMKKQVPHLFFSRSFKFGMRNVNSVWISCFSNVSEFCSPTQFQRVLFLTPPLLPFHFDF